MGYSTLEERTFPLSFPPEIWANIAVYIPAEQLGRLKLAGCKQLWSKIRAMPHLESAIVGLDQMLFKVWPAFLNEISRILSLELHDPCYVWFPKCHLKLDMMPATLRKLKLNIPGANLDEFFRGPDQSYLRLNIHTPALESLDLPLDWQSPIKWMDHIPASLTTLRIHTWGGCQALPASLKHFFMDYSQSLTDFNFPIELESFVCGEFCWGGFNPSVYGQKVRQLTSKFPSSLRRFAGWIPAGLLGDDLPQSLTSLEGVPCTIYPSCLTKLDCKTSPKTWPTLPSSITVFKSLLDFPNNTTSSIDCRNLLPVQLLPKSITHLTLRRPVLRDPVPTVDFDDSFGGVDSGPSLPLTPITMGMFPPFLRTLQLRSANLSENAAKQLPPSLTILDVYFLDHLIAKHIPGKVTSLRCITAKLTEELFESLPDSLTSFCIFHDQFNNLPDWESNFKTRFRSIEHPLQWGDEYSLPASLTTLVLKLTEDFSDSFLRLHKLPRLETLKVPASTHVTDSGISFLPRSLTCLNLDLSSQITGKSFKDLPATLTALKMSSSSEIFDVDIPSLPPHLDTLHLDSAIHLTDLCVRHFPRSLGHLSLKRNRLLSRNSMRDLPKRMISLSFTTQYFETAVWKLADLPPL